MAISPTIAMNVSPKAQAAFVELHRQCYNVVNQQWNIRNQMRDIDLAYMRENDFTKEHREARKANKYGDPTKYKNVVIPVVMPQVEASVVYQSSVFLTGNPIFEFISVPQYEDQAAQMNAIIEDQQNRGGWIRELQMFFRDGFKYGICGLEIDWEQEVTASLETDIKFSATQGKPKEVVWEGNVIKRLDLYNTFWDTRVPPAEVYKYGEFAGYTKLMSRVALKDFIGKLPAKIIANIKPAFESGMGATTQGGLGGIESFYMPQLNPDALMQANPRLSTDWMAWAGLAMQGKNIEIMYKNQYEVTTLYARILPSDFGLNVPSANTPQVWKLIFVNHQVLVYAERQTNAHGYLPILFGQPLEDGLFLQTKSLAQNVQPLQEVASAMMAANIASLRRSISDRGLFDPSRVSPDNINSDNPSAKIPVRPSAYGKPLQEAYYPIPFNNDSFQYLNPSIQMIQGLANTVAGHNQAQQGQFVKGNKTLHEYDDVMNRANGRDQACSIFLEAQVFRPLKEILKINILQYQAGGTVYSSTAKQAVKIDPVQLRQAVMQFKVADGLLPSDKLINEDVLQTAFQAISQPNSPIGAAYNIAPLFSYLMKTQNADLTPFEKSPQQQAYEQAMQQWQQMCMQIAQNNPNIQQNQYPPQPTPQQFGYNPQQQDPNNQQGQPQGQGQQPPAQQGAMDGTANIQ